MFVEARAGWVDERGHAEPRIPGFGWEQMLGEREKQLLPSKEFVVKWGTEQFKAVKFKEEFEVASPAARAIAFSDQRTAIDYETRYNRGTAILFGSFAGQENY